MGWWSAEGEVAECQVGDEPVDAMRGHLDGIARERRVEMAALLETLVAALNHDGKNAPVFAERYQVGALVVPENEARIAGRAPVEPMLAPIYGMLESVAAAYVERHGRPPKLREILRCFEIALDPDKHVAKGAAWSLGTARFELSTSRKAMEARPPNRPPPAPAVPVRVRHAKFGEGTVIAESGDRVEVEFAGGEKKKLVKRVLEFL